MFKINAIVHTIKRIPTATAVVSGLCLLFLVIGAVVGADLRTSISAALAGFGSWGLFALAMVPTIRAGIGPNFMVPVGVICGTWAMILALSFGFTAASFLLVSAIISIFFSCIAGYLCGKIMNTVPGYEMVVAVFTGFAVTFLFSFITINLPMYLMLPEQFFMGFPVRGFRTPISLAFYDAGYLLAEFLQFEVFGVTVRTGELIVIFVAAMFLWIFFKTKAGRGMMAAGSNPAFAKANGIDAARVKITAMMISMGFCALGFVVMTSAAGMLRLYDAPLFMAFPAAAAIFAGGATLRGASIKNAIIGVLLLQGFSALSFSVFLEIFQDGYSTGVSAGPETIQIAVRHGVILIALIKGGSYVFRREHDL